VRITLNNLIFYKPVLLIFAAVTDYLFCSLSYDRSIAFPKWLLHTLWSSASPSNLHHSVVSLRSYSSCLRLSSRLPVTTTLQSTFLSVACFRRQFLCKMWPIQLTFLLCIAGRTFLSPFTPSNTSPFLTRSVQLISTFLQDKQRKSRKLQNEILLWKSRSIEQKSTFTFCTL